MTTLPHDVSRCWGVYHPPLGTGYAELLQQCRDRLRRTAPREDNRLYSYIQPPEFTDTCPERIAP